MVQDNISSILWYRTIGYRPDIKAAWISKPIFWGPMWLISGFDYTCHCTVYYSITIIASIQILSINYSWYCTKINCYFSIGIECGIAVKFFHLCFCLYVSSRIPALMFCYPFIGPSTYNGDIINWGFHKLIGL